MADFAEGGYIPGPPVLARIDPQCEVIITRDQVKRYGERFLASIRDDRAEEAT
jgi:hypothetical protein